MSCGLLFHSKFDFATLSYVARGTSTAQPIIIIIIRLWVVLLILPPPHRIVHILCVRLLNFNAHIYSRNPISLTQNKYLCGGRNCAVFSHQKRINWLVNQKKMCLYFSVWPFQKAAATTTTKTRKVVLILTKLYGSHLFYLLPDEGLYTDIQKSIASISVGVFCSVLFCSICTEKKPSIKMFHLKVIMAFIWQSECLPFQKPKR